MTDAPGALLGELRRAEAAELARAGDYDAAVRVLDGLDDLDGEAATGTLLARIHAQRGDFAGAEQAWRRALAAAPDDATAQEGLALTVAIREGRTRRRPLPVGTVGTMGAVGAAAVAVAVTVAAAVVPALTTDPEQSAGTPPSRPTTSSTTTVSTASPEVGTREWSRQVAERLTAPGVRVEEAPNRVRVVFEHGLFLPDLAEFTPTGREALTRFARRLADTDGRVTVIGHGVVVDGGPRTGGSVVALTRAAEAARLLAESTGQPITRFAIRSTEQTDTPHPGDGEADRARNRTVTVVVTPR